MAGMFYPWGVSGASVTEILKESKKLTYAVGVTRRERTRYWRISGDERQYMHGLSLLEPGDKLTIRFGWRGSIPDECESVQPLRGMIIAANKIRFRRWAMENEISVPLTWTLEDEPEELPSLILGRPFRHRKGEDYHIIRLEEYPDIRKPDVYYSALYEKDAEYRVYTFGGYVWCVSQKHPAKGVSSTDPWNFSGGRATFKILKNREWSRDVCILAMNTCYKLGLLFAGVDIIVAGGMPYIVEINTAPGIRGRLKPKNFGRLVDQFIGEWEKDFAPGVVDPSTISGSIRHPLLRGG